MKTKRALLDQSHEMILDYIVNPDESELPAEQQEIMARVISVSKLLDKYPTMKMTVKLHLSKFPHISEPTAYRDVQLARKVYNSVHTFDFDFWKNWLLNDIVQNINECRSKFANTVAHKKVIAMEHAILMKTIGEKPEELDDPHRNEKHSFYIMVNVDNKNIKVDVNNLHKLPEQTLGEINKLLNAGREIDEQGAAEIMES